MPLCVRLCVCALVSLCISRDALYCNSFWQSCPTRGKTCVSPFLRRHKNSEPKYAYEWFMGSLKTIPETWTHTLPFLTQTHTHTHTHTWRWKGSKEHFLSGAACQELQTAFYLKLSWWFPEHDSFFILFAFLNLLNVSTCTAVRGTSGSRRGVYMSSLAGKIVIVWERMASVDFNLSDYLSFENKDRSVENVNWIKRVSSSLCWYDLTL